VQISKVVHETRASQPEGCLPFLLGEPCHTRWRRPCRYMGQQYSMLESASSTENERTISLAVFFHRLNPHPHTSISGDEESVVNKQPSAGAGPSAPKQGHSLGSGASLRITFKVRNLSTRSGNQQVLGDGVIHYVPFPRKGTKNSGKSLSAQLLKSKCSVQHLVTLCFPNLSSATGQWKVQSVSEACALAREARAASRRE